MKRRTLLGIGAGAFIAAALGISKIDDIEGKSVKFDSMQMRGETIDNGDFALWMESRLKSSDGKVINIYTETVKFTPDNMGKDHAYTVARNILLDKHQQMVDKLLVDYNLTLVG